MRPISMFNELLSWAATTQLLLSCSITAFEIENVQHLERRLSIESLREHDPTKASRSHFRLRRDEARISAIELEVQPTSNGQFGLWLFSSCSE